MLAKMKLVLSVLFAVWLVSMIITQCADAIVAWAFVLGGMAR